MYQLIMVTIMLLALVSCGGESDQCKYSTPVAIFQGIDKIENHTFEATGNNAVEHIFVPSMGMDVELYQSGCNELEQEFRFHIHEALPLNIPPQECAMLTAVIFDKLSGLSPNLIPLAQWAGAIKENAEAFKYNEKIRLKGTPMQVQLDKVHQSNSTMLTVIFKETKEE